MRVALPSLVLLTFVACGGSEPAPAAPTASGSPPPSSSSTLVVTPAAPADVNDATPGKPQTGKIYALVVSFISPGNGTDSAAYDRLRGVVRDVGGVARTGQVSGHWGKEGEHDECFDLHAMSFTEKKQFVQRVHLAATSDRVTISEGARCRNER